MASTITFVVLIVGLLSSVSARPVTHYQLDDDIHTYEMFIPQRHAVSEEQPESATDTDHINKGTCMYNHFK